LARLGHLSRQRDDHCLLLFATADHLIRPAHFAGQLFHRDPAGGEEEQDERPKLEQAGHRAGKDLKAGGILQHHAQAEEQDDDRDHREGGVELRLVLDQLGITDADEDEGGEDGCDAFHLRDDDRCLSEGSEGSEGGEYRNHGAPEDTQGGAGRRVMKNRTFAQLIGAAE
jgi:hypothetical protein